MKRLILTVFALMTLATNAAPVEELVSIPYPIRYHKSAGLNAYADGYNIVIGTELRDFVNDENQLGLIILHESYHNVLNHRNVLADDIQEFCNGMPIKTNADIGNCISLHAALRYYKYRELEQEADLGAFRTAKKIGYTTNVCDVFLRLRERLGDNSSPLATHPSFVDRYNTCIKELRGE